MKTSSRTALSRIARLARRLHDDERGQAMTEYVVILCSISLVALTVIGQIAEHLVGFLGDAVDGLDVVETNLE